MGQNMVVSSREKSTIRRSRHISGPCQSTRATLGSSPTLEWQWSLLEPRQTEGRGSDATTAVVWLPNYTLAEAQHKLRITERALAVARFGNRYGVRVPSKEAEQIHTQLNPEVPFSNFGVTKVFELRPLPHGTQKLGVLNMLKAWKWKARPLQPCKSDAQGMG